MWYEWDDSKNLANYAKHGLAFEKVLGFEWNTAMEVPDERKDYGESRWIAIGMIGTRLHTLVYTKRTRILRVISLRKSNLRERKAYETQNRQT